MEEEITYWKIGAEARGQASGPVAGIPAPSLLPFNTAADGQSHPSEVYTAWGGYERRSRPGSETELSSRPGSAHSGNKTSSSYFSVPQFPHL